MLHGIGRPGSTLMCRGVHGCVRLAGFAAPHCRVYELKSDVPEIRNPNCNWVGAGLTDAMLAAVLG